MNRDTAKPTSDCESNGSKGDTILPDDKQLAARYIQWKNLIDKYDKPYPDDDEGVPIEDALEVYHVGDTTVDKKLATQDEALECSDDDDVVKKENSSDFAALEKQMTTALKQRTAEWKNNGMEQIFNSNFSLSVDYVQKWMEECTIGTGRQVTQERETRFTEYGGNTQMDVTHRENVSVLNEAVRKQLTTEQSSNYEFCDNDQRRVVVHQIEKTIISSYLTVDPNATTGSSKGAALTLPLDSFLGNITSFTPFKIPAAIEQLRSTGRDRHGMQQQRPHNKNMSANCSETLSNLLKSSLKLVPKNRVESYMQKNPQKPAPRVRFKPVKKTPMRRKPHDTSSSSECSSASKSSSYSSDESTSSEETCKPKNRIHTLKAAQLRSKKQFLSSSTCTSSSESCSANSSSSTEKVNGKDVSLRNDTSSKQKSLASSVANQSDTKNETREQYLMPANYRQMLSVNGRCRYKTDGTVIYRPKPNHQGLSRNADKILIKTQDLDLTGIKCSLKRKKFDNFSRHTHPNSVLVYYMSDSDAEPQNVPPADSDEEDTSDDDDPILSYKPELCILTFFNDEAQRS